MPTELKLSDNKENMPLDVYMYYRNKEEHIKNYYGATHWAIKYKNKYL